MVWSKNFFKHLIELNFKSSGNSPLYPWIRFEFLVLHPRFSGVKELLIFTTSSPSSLFNFLFSQSSLLPIRLVFVFTLLTCSISLALPIFHSRHCSGYLGEEHSKQREQKVQRPWVRRVLEIFKATAAGVEGMRGLVDQDLINFKEIERL